MDIIQIDQIDKIYDFWEIGLPICIKGIIKNPYTGEEKVICIDFSKEASDVLFSEGQKAYNSYIDMEKSVEEYFSNQKKISIDMEWPHE